LEFERIFPEKLEKWFLVDLWEPIEGGLCLVDITQVEGVVEREIPDHIS